MKQSKSNHHYSGPKSKKFWKDVNALPEPYKSELYSCGVLLQNMEHSVLQWLKDAKNQAKNHKK